MKLRRSGVIFCLMTVASPVLCMLPMPTPPEMQTLPPPPSPPPQLQTSGTSNGGQASGTSSVEFDFKGFFDYFIKIYGRDALMVFQQRLNDRKTAEGLASVNVPGEPIPCGLANSYPGAALTYDHANRIHGSTAKYSCQVGFKGPEAIIMCISGIWSEPKIAVNCQTVTCGQPPVMQNGHVTFTDLNHGATATYTCDPGFQANDIAAPIRCGPDGRWTQPSFACVNMMADHQRMSQMAHMQGMMGQMGGAMGNMMSAMGGAGGMGGGAGLNPAMMGAIAQAMGAQAGAGGAAGGNMGPMMAAMMAGGAAGAAPPNPQGALPPHLVGLGKMVPMLMPGMMGGPMGGAGMAPATGPGGKPLEPEQQQEQALMAMMMHNMHEQQRRREAQRLQLLRQRELQAEQQRQQQMLQQQQEQQQKTSGINISELLAKTGGTSTSQMDALKGAMEKLGGTNNNQLMSALQTLSALADALKSQTGGSSSSSSSSSGGASIPTSGGQTSQAQGSSVFGSGAGGVSSSQQAPPSSAPSSSSGNSLQNAIMAAALQG